MRIAWVVGSGGLLGTAMCRALRCDGIELFTPAERFCWNGGTDFDFQMATAVRAFASQAEGADEWEVYWAAGVGTMNSSKDALAPETCALALMLRLLEAHPGLMATTGALAFASSAGAIYAGSQDDIITENSALAPTTAYAREKLRQEALVSSFALTNPRTSALLARISTVYGPGQANSKQQGLLTHIARRILRNQPIQIFVPYDTIRDYIAADDAAAAMISALRITNGKPRVLTKIIASEHPATIAEIISIFKRIARRAPRIVTSANGLSGLYSRRVQFHSIALPEYERQPAKSLPVGIAKLMMEERASFVRSSAN